MSAFSVVKNVVIVCDIGQFSEVLDVYLTPQMMWRVLGHFASLLSSFALRGSDRSSLPVMVGGAEDGAGKGLTHCGFTWGATEASL